MLLQALVHTGMQFSTERTSFDYNLWDVNEKSKVWLKVALKIRRRLSRYRPDIKHILFYVNAIKKLQATLSIANHR